MDTIYSVNKLYLNTRIDKWIRKNICDVPQGLIEKNLRNSNKYNGIPIQAKNAFRTAN